MFAAAVLTAHHGIAELVAQIRKLAERYIIAVFLCDVAEVLVIIVCIPCRDKLGLELLVPFAAA